MIVLRLSDSQPRPLFHLLAESMSNALHLQSALYLFLTIAHRQGPHLHEIAQTPLLEILLRISLVVYAFLLCVLSSLTWIFLKQEEPSLVLIAEVVSGLVMVLPHILSSLPPLRSRLVAILRRLLVWPSTINSELSCGTIPTRGVCQS